MNFPRAITRIHQIELTSRCNLACVYCPHPKMQRAKIDMDVETFGRCLQWVRYFQELGTQPELSLTGIGEALLHPDFLHYLWMTRCMFGGELLFSTNGLEITDEICEALKRFNVTTYVSLHRPEAAGPAIAKLMRHGVKGHVNAGFATSALNWAGTVDWEVTAPKAECQYLRQGWGTVLSDGSITTCCMDSEGLGIVGHVNDEIGSLALKPYSLCGACHLSVPEAA